MTFLIAVTDIWQEQPKEGRVSFSSQFGRTIRARKARLQLGEGDGYITATVKEQSGMLVLSSFFSLSTNVMLFSAGPQFIGYDAPHLQSGCLYSVKPLWKLLHRHIQSAILNAVRLTVKIHHPRRWTRDPCICINRTIFQGGTIFYRLFFGCTLKVVEVNFEDGNTRRHTSTLCLLGPQSSEWMGTLLTH